MRGNRNQDNRYYSDEDEDDRLPDRRREQFPYQPSYQQPVQQRDQNVDIGKSSMQLKDVLVGAVAIGGFLFSGFVVWSNLTQKMSTIEIKIEQIQKDGTKDVQQMDLELRKLVESFNLHVISNTKKMEILDERIQDLDSTITQLYNSNLEHKK